MHPYARPIAELRSSLREMLAHDMTNPDNDPHLSGVMFFCVTDEHSRQLIERIELLASEVECRLKTLMPPSRITKAISGQSMRPTADPGRLIAVGAEGAARCSRRWR